MSAAEEITRTVESLREQAVWADDEAESSEITAARAAASAKHGRERAASLRAAADAIEAHITVDA